MKERNDLYAENYELREENQNLKNEISDLKNRINTVLQMQEDNHEKWKYLGNIWSMTTEQILEEREVLYGEH